MNNNDPLLLSNWLEENVNSKIKFRTYNALKSGLTTSRTYYPYTAILEDKPIFDYTDKELLSLRNFGKKSLKNFRQAVEITSLLIKLKQEAKLSGKEIRIGNYVKDRSGKILRVDFIEYVEEGYNTKFGQEEFIEGEEIHRLSEFSDFAQPIPITPEWLDNFGLTYLEDASWELGSMRIYNLSDDEKARFRITLAGHELVILNYVHQLQNFYNAITFKELTLCN